MASASILKWFPGTLYNSALNVVVMQYKAVSHELRIFPPPVHFDVLYKVRALLLAIRGLLETGFTVACTSVFCGTCVLCNAHFDVLSKMGSLLFALGSIRWLIQGRPKQLLHWGSIYPFCKFFLSSTEDFSIRFRSGWVASFIQGLTPRSFIKVLRIVKGFVFLQKIFLQHKAFSKLA